MIHFIETAKFAMPATGHQALSYTIFLYRFDAKTTCHTPFPPMLKIVLEMPTSEGKKNFCMYTDHRFWLRTFTQTPRGVENRHVYQHIKTKQHCKAIILKF